MFTITVKTSFIAKHSLKLPDGTNEPVHEHKWRVIVAVSSEELDSMGCVMDFHVLKQMLDTVLGPMSGIELEKFDYFSVAGINASAENVCKYLYDSLLSQITDNRINLSYVKVMESPGCWAKYAVTSKKS